MISQYDTDSSEVLAAISVPEPKHIWVHGSITFIYTEEDIPEDVYSS